MKKAQGFTLIEILFALMIFTVLATITTSAMQRIFNTRSHVNAQADKLSSLQLALSRIKHDTLQVVDRPVRGDEMRLFAAFIGKPSYIEFTRSGISNPSSLEKRSNMQRVAYLCKNNQLIRRNWESLDSSNRNSTDKVLLKDLTTCKFAFLNHNQQVLAEWRENAIQENQRKETLPKAIQFNFKMQTWGNMSTLFILSGALYAQK